MLQKERDARQTVGQGHLLFGVRRTAAGALRAAIFLQDRAPGLYDMGDLV